MTAPPLCLPVDELIGTSVDFDRAADFLEFSAFFAHDSTVPTSALTNQADIGALEEHPDLDEEMRAGKRTSFRAPSHESREGGVRWVLPHTHSSWTRAATF